MFIGEGQDWLDGLERAWTILATLDPTSVCRQANADFDEKTGHYVLPFFNETIYISPAKKQIWSDCALADRLLNELSHYSRLSALWYLIQAKDTPLSGNLISPRQVDGGLIFALGSHMLPLNKLEEKYGRNVSGLVRRGVELGGEPLHHGDASVRLFPFPRVPVILLVWKYDEEFPARADILFDATCSTHLPTDIIWSTAMMSLLVML